MDQSGEKIKKLLKKKLKPAREEKNMTQAEVAKRAGISANYYARVERGDPNPRSNVVKEILRVLDIDPSEIFSN